MDKKWYDDWSVTEKANGDILDSITVSFPNSKGDFTNVTFVGDNLENKGLRWLISLVDSLGFELAEKKGK